ncbi:MAG: hypothetical protein J1F24_04345 [Oscillospiraceae bacterium]|nr:hypothetical protein [Oscillospiraceae bacterium]
MRIIESESKYIFDTDENRFPTFTKKNIEFLNAILQYDSNYRSSSYESDSNNEDTSDKEDKYKHVNTIKEYEESYAGILQRNKDNFFNSFDMSNINNTSDDLYKVIESIDKINSTHLASEGNTPKKDENEERNKGRERFAKKIRSLGGNRLKERLESNSKEDRAKLVEELANKDVAGKLNFSFATKFCAYVSTHALNDPDNFCIYDNVVQSVLPYYAKMYVDESVYNEKKYSGLYKTIKDCKQNNYQSRNESLVEERYRETNNYKGYMELIDDIIAGIENKTGEKITYQDFDHIVWYYFKGSKGRVLDAMERLPKKDISKKGKKQKNSKSDSI